MDPPTPYRAINFRMPQVLIEFDLIFSLSWDDEFDAQSKAIAPHHCLAKAIICASFFENATAEVGMCEWTMRQK